MNKILLSAAAAMLALAARLPAQTGQLSDSALDAQTKVLASQLRCPVCQGLSVQDSPAELAQQMRAIARQQLAEGRSPAEVRSYFIARYGEWILMAPPPHGFSSLVYLGPLLLLVAGSVGLAIAVRRWTAPPGADSPALF